MCNAVSTSKWQVQNKGITHRGDGSRARGPKEAPLERYKKCCDSDVSSMQRVAGITHSEVHWIFHHLAQSLDSPLYLTNFQIVTVCVGACVRTYVRAWISFLAIPLFVICWVICSVCIMIIIVSSNIIGKTLIFLLLWKWMIFNLLKKKIHFVTFV